MDKFWTKLFNRRVDPELIQSYRTVLPDSIHFHLKKEGGKIVITITQIDDRPLQPKTLLVTQADNRKEVVAMVNDLLMSYLDIPSELRPYYERELKLKGTLTKDSVLVKA